MLELPVLPAIVLSRILNKGTSAKSNMNQSWRRVENMDLECRSVFVDFS